MAGLSPITRKQWPETGRLHTTARQVGWQCRFLRKALETNGFAYFLCLRRGVQQSDQVQTELNCSAGPSGSGDFAVRDDAFRGENAGQFIGHGEVGGIAPAGEQAGVVQDGRRGADGRQPAAGGVLPSHDLAHAWIGPQVLHAGATGEKNEVEVLSGHRGERGVAVRRDAAAPGGVAVVVQRGDRDLDTGAAQQVDGRERLDFLKTIGERDEHGGHGKWVSSKLILLKQILPADDAMEDSLSVPSAPSAGSLPCSHMSSLQGKRLVIFGCGYVGTALARAALAAGARVEALTRNPDKAADLRALGLANVVVADLAADGWHAKIPPAPDFAVDCVSSGGPENYRQSYVGGMQSILAWAAKGPAPIGTLAYTSSTAVYPQGGGAVVDEEAEAPGSTPNGAIIRESEILLQQAAVTAVRRHFILRLAGIYGPGRHHLLDQLREGRPVLGGSGEHRLNLVHRDDIVAAILACLGASAATGSGIFNVADTTPAPRHEVVGWLAAKLGRPAPGFDGSTTSRRGGAPMPDRAISSARITRVLGWHPRFPDYRAGFENILSP